MLLREPCAEDFEFYYELKCEPSSVYWSGFEKAPDKENLNRHFQRLINKEFANRDFYMLEDKGRLVGYIQLTHNTDTEVEIGYGVSEKYRGHGYGYFLLAQAKELVCRMDECVNLIGYVRDDNHSSKKCFEKNGFERKPEYVERYFALESKNMKMFLYKWNKGMDKISLFSNKPNTQLLNYKIGDTSVYMKRDDLLDFAFGGNKVRLFEYIAADVAKKGAKKIITFGSIHSNHIRVAAAIACRMGIACDLIILYEKEEENGIISPNLKLVKYCGDVHVEYCSTEAAHDFIDEYLCGQEEAGCKYYWIPGGGHIGLAARGYADAAGEILEQLSGISVDAFFLPCGTGTTQAGLIAGTGGKIPVYGVTVARSVERCRSEITALLREMGKTDINEDDIHVLQSDIRYGENSAELNEMISCLVKSDGIFLDPIYNAKSFLEMTRYIGIHPEIKTAVYINTGGTPNLF